MEYCCDIVKIDCQFFGWSKLQTCLFKLQFNANRKRVVVSLDICRASLRSYEAVPRFRLQNFQSLARNHERHLALLATKLFLSFLLSFDSIYDDQL